MHITKQKYTAKKAYKQITSSIAFYPVMITLSLLSLSWCVVYLDSISIGTYLIQKVPVLLIDNPSTATSLLSSLLTGLISLVTFSFSMVMIVLTQIMASFSPRLIPDLVKKRGNQMVLGIIVGTICYTTVVLSNIDTIPSGPKVPLLSVAINMFLGLSSIIMFVYFIHQISNDIQIGNIINNIYRTTKRVLDRELTSDSYHEDWVESEQFFLVKAWESGYFNTLTQNDFRKRAKKHDLKVRLLKNQGMYLLKGDPFLEINKPLNDHIKELLEENILFRHQEIAEDNYIYGFKHLTEIAVKALSPGINDQGTAIHAIDYLSDLLCRLQQLRGQKVFKYDDGTACIIYMPVPFETVFYLCLASIRPYSAEDVTVQSRLITLISKIAERDERNTIKPLLEKELDSIEEASTQEMKSREDIEFIKTLLQKARQTLI